MKFKKQIFFCCSSLMMISLFCQASQVEIYGKEVPIGFYNYLQQSQTSEDEKRALFTDDSYVNSGMTRLTLTIIEWDKKCVNRLSELKDSHNTCHEKAKRQYSEQLDTCSTESTKGGFMLPFWGRISWKSSTNHCAQCFDLAKNQLSIAEGSCDNKFELATLEEKTCWGANGWDLVVEKSSRGY